MTSNKYLNLVLGNVVFIFFILLFQPTALAETTIIKHARIATQLYKTQLVFVLSQPTAYKTFTLKNPDRLVVDLSDTTLATDLSELNLKFTLIRAVRVGHNKKQLRMVFDLKKPVNVKAYLLDPQLHYRDRLVIALTPETALKVTQTQSKPSIKQGKPVKQDIPLKVSASRDIIVVIDPGHGGKDPGAIGAHGTHEKAVVLAISRDLYRLMQQEKGLKPVLTRNGDYFVTLRGRLKKARDSNADMFVAIHADAFKNRSAHGASVYALSQRGASSEAARWLAQKENYSELGGVDLSDLPEQDKVLRSVLIDLSQTATIAQSLDIGQAVLNQLGRFNRLHHGGVEQARFVVLKSPDIPSILIETGFLSNPSEEKKLRTSSYQKRIARAILHGIKSYFKEHPPHGTLYAKQRALRQKRLAKRSYSLRYTVKKGDNLTLLAQRFYVSTAQIRQQNQLKDNHIHVGQKLIIPKNA